MDKKLNVKFEPPAAALAKWNPDIKAAVESPDAVSVNIYSSIGDYGDGTGFTLSLLSGILRKAENRDVVVNINSAGGDFFEGVSIYNALREYNGKVVVRVVGLAASAASVIAMAGDEIKIGEAAFMMIHNAWTVAIGNKDDMYQVADMLAKFDDTMADIYSKRAGVSLKDAKKMMSAETWIGGAEAVDFGFADSLLASDMIGEGEPNKVASALRRIDTALAKSGMPRTERRALIKEISSTPSATDETVTPSADDKLTDALAALHLKLIS